MKKENKVITLVGKTKKIKLKNGHEFLVKPGFMVIKTHRNTYAVTFVNERSARFYQGTAGGIVCTNIGMNDFARRFNIAENFILEIIPKMRERIWEWCSRDAVLDESMTSAVDAVKKYSIDELCDRTEYLILDSLGDKTEYTWLSRTTTPGVYEHRTIPEMLITVTDSDYVSVTDYFCEGFVVLTKSRLEKLREAEARLYADADTAADADCELTIDINYGEFFKEEPSEGFRYKHPESFDDYVLKNVPMWRKPVEKLPPHWWRETLDTDTEE